MRRRTSSASSGRQFGDEVGSVVGLHDVQNVGGARRLESGDYRYAVVVTELLEHVGQARVGELLGDRHLAVVGQGVNEVR